MCLYSIATEYNGPLEAAHAHIDNDRYDIVECGAAGQPTLELDHSYRQYGDFAKFVLLVDLTSIATHNCIGKHRPIAHSKKIDIIALQHRLNWLWILLWTSSGHLRGGCSITGGREQIRIEVLTCVSSLSQRKTKATRSGSGSY